MSAPRSALTTTEVSWIDAPAVPFPDVPAAYEVGCTERAHVFVDASLGPRGTRVAQEVLVAVEDDIDVLISHFGGAPLVLAPVFVVITQMSGVERAYHYGAGGAALYCDARIVPQVESRYTRFLLNTLLADLFIISHGSCWNPDDAAGEALSRVLATARYPKQIAGFATAPVWLNSDRPDCTVATGTSDRDPVAVGGAVLFLHWLHHQLGYSWREIVDAGSADLAEVHGRLSSQQNDPFAAFAAELATLYPPGRPVDLITDNPYPRTPKLGRAGPVHANVRGRRDPVGGATSLADVSHQLPSYEVLAEEPWAGAPAGYQRSIHQEPLIELDVEMDDDEQWSGSIDVAPGPSPTACLEMVELDDPGPAHR